MTARADAIQAMADAIVRQEDEHSGSPAHQLALVALDAVPPRVLAQLAIDTGGFIEDGRQVFTHSESLPNGRIRNHFTPLYRLAEDGGLGGS